MKRETLTLPVVVAALLLMVGCAATPMVQQTRPGTDLSSRYNAVQVIVEPHQITPAPHGYDITSAELLREFIDNTRAAGKFASVGTDVADGKVLEARLIITALNYVSGAARGLVGIAAGRAVLDVTMTLKDKETGTVVDVVRANHASHHGQGVFSPTTSRQVSAIAKELSSSLVGGGSGK